jgi:hypothetical protein
MFCTFIRVRDRFFERSDSILAGSAAPGASSR